MGIGDWGLGSGPNPQSPIPNPQSPIPNEKFLFYYHIIKKNNLILKIITNQLRNRIKINNKIIENNKINILTLIQRQIY